MPKVLQMLRTAPTTQNDLAPNVNNTEESCKNSSEFCLPFHLASPSVNFQHNHRAMIRHIVQCEKSGNAPQDTTFSGHFRYTNAVFLLQDGTITHTGLQPPFFTPWYCHNYLYLSI